MTEKKIPEVKQWVILREPEIIRRNTIDDATYGYLFCYALTFNKYFGETDKEKDEFYNDISVFETGCFVISKLIDYIEKKYPERRLLSFRERFNKEKLKEKIELKDDILNLLVYILDVIYTKKLNWNNTKQLIFNRIKFWRRNFNSAYFYHSVFMRTIIKSNTIISPIENIQEVPFSLDEGLTNHTNRLIDIKSFEDAMLPVFFEQIDNFFKSNATFGYEIKNNWK